MQIANFLQTLIEKKHLSMEDTYNIMNEISTGNLLEAQIGALLALFQAKGVTADELAGFAKVLREKAEDFPAPGGEEKRLDTCGTGGSKQSKTFNVSTTVSLLAAAGGIKVVKHGNNAVTSKSGSADLLEKLGLDISISPQAAFEVYDKLNFTFLYAKKFHSAMRFVAPVRKALGIRTLFNLIGPLSNPAYATHQIIGVFSGDYTETFCSALNLLRTKRALVVHGLDGLDEISLCAPTKITELQNGWIKSYIFDPQSIGLKLVDHASLIGGDPDVNKEITMSILKGEDSDKANLVYLNAGAAFYIYGEASSIKEGFEMARETAKSGKALKLVEELVRETQSRSSK